MSSLFDCGCENTVLTKVDSVTCKVRKPKVQGLLFRMQTGATFVVGTNDVSDPTSWHDLFDTDDSTLIIRTPDIASFDTGEAETITGDANYEGAETVDAVLPQQFTAVFHNLPPTAQKQLQDLYCAGYSLEVAFIYSNDELQLESDGSVTPSYDFWPVSPETMIVHPPTREGTLGAKFMTKMEFKLDSDWYGDSGFVKPDDGFSFVKDLKQGFTATP